MISRALVAPSRFWIEPWTSKTNELPSFRTSLKRRSARAGGRLVGPHASQQLVEQGAQRVPGARGGDRLAADLLGARVGRGPQREAGQGGRAALAGTPRIEEFGDAEVEQLGRTVRRDED